MSDRRLLYASAFLRAFATGLIGVLLGLYLARRGFSAAAFGIVIGCGLSGAALSALLVTFIGDRVGRRRALVVLALATAAGGLALLATSHVAAAGVVAFLGMINGMGRDRGASLVLEQAALPATTAAATRTRAFAWYNVLQDAGHALGRLAAEGADAADAVGLKQVRVAQGWYPDASLFRGFQDRRLIRDPNLFAIDRKCDHSSDSRFY